MKDNSNMHQYGLMAISEDYSGDQQIPGSCKLHRMFIRSNACPNFIDSIDLIVSQESPAGGDAPVPASRARSRARRDAPVPLCRRET
jgi:hypothetical protein